LPLFHNSNTAIRGLQLRCIVTNAEWARKSRGKARIAFDRALREYTFDSCLYFPAGAIPPVPLVPLGPLPVPVPVPVPAELGLAGAFELAAPDPV